MLGALLGKARLSRQLRRELLRRRPDQLPDRRRQRSRPQPDARRCRRSRRARSTCRRRCRRTSRTPTDVRVPDRDVRLHVQRAATRRSIRTSRRRTSTTGRSATSASCGATRAIEIRYVGNRGSNLWRGYNINETNIFENGFLQEFRNAQRNLAINLANGAHRLREPRPAGPGRRCRSSTRRSARAARSAAVPAASGFTNGTFITQLAAGAGGPAGEHARRRLPLPLRDGRQRAARLHAAAATTRPGPYPINVFQANPVRRGQQQCAVLTDEAQSKYDALQLQFRQRYSRGISLTANYTYGKSRTDRYVVGADSAADYTTLRDKGAQLGSDRLRPAPHVPDLRHLRPAVRQGTARRRSRTRSSTRSFGGWSASGVVAHPDRPAVPADQRPSDAQPGGRRRRPQRHHRRGSAEDGQRPSRPNGNVFFFDETLIGADGRANPDAHRARRRPPASSASTCISTARASGPPTSASPRTSASPGGSRINFEALFINAFNHRNSLVGGTGGATFSIDSTTFGQTTTAAHRRAADSVQAGVLFLNGCHGRRVVRFGARGCRSSVGCTEWAPDHPSNPSNLRNRATELRLRARATIPHAHLTTTIRPIHSSGRDRGLRRARRGAARAARRRSSAPVPEAIRALKPLAGQSRADHRAGAAARASRRRAS